MSEAARRELQRWGEGLVCVSRDAPARSELVLRLRSVGPHGPATTVSLQFERDSHWWVENITSADVAPHEVVMHHRGAQQTRVARLLLPAGLERALHVGQFATRELDLPTVATPFVRSHIPAASRLRPRDVIVWMEFAARSRLALWWASASFPRAKVWVVPIPRDRPTQEEVCSIRSARELMSAAPGIRRLTARQVARFATNWRAWMRGHAGFRPAALPGWLAQTQWVGEVPKPIYDLFPRLGAPPQLSPYDYELLKLLGTDWSSTLAAIVRLLRSPDDRLMQVWGDMTIHQRLHAWSRWKRGRYVEHRPSQSDKAFSRFEYRLTEEGERLLSGMPALDLAPPFEFGSFRFYTPGSWVMTPRGPRRAPRRLFASQR
ncbi:MAG: hypothetical protein Q8L14_10185 [Myxococcales bacterium]|nr:hypothetical protein [Myxococcales bacterium]